MFKVAVGSERCLLEIYLWEYEEKVPRSLGTIGQSIHVIFVIMFFLLKYVGLYNIFLKN